MAINRWWRDEPAERYWMEITSRADLGSDLKAPQTNDAGAAYWSYNLVADVRDGDVVLHWHKSLAGTPAIVGLSVVDGAPYESSIVWSSRGSYGRLRPSTDAEPSWMCDLREYRPLPELVTQETIRDVEPSLRAVLADLEQRHAKPVYFPFAFSDKRPVRTAQGYLVKFPAALLDVIPALSVVPRAIQRAQPNVPPIRREPRTRHIADPALRKAIEGHAVARAIEFYVAEGFDVEDVGAYEPYDLRVVRGREERHVEVKGSTAADISSVELTDGEVRHAPTAPTDLFVVDSVQWWREADGSIRTAGGRTRRWNAWIPAADALSPTRYRYALPG